MSNIESKQDTINDEIRAIFRIHHRGLKYELIRHHYFLNIGDEENAFDAKSRALFYGNEMERAAQDYPDAFNCTSNMENKMKDLEILATL
ncbi:MAG: hypothetical protein CBB80_011185 [Synechococcus sp. TMED20]|nr:MAG: hypothetical protein CBB80_011185 [Synechococcus sp. TMED20]